MTMDTPPPGPSRHGVTRRGAHYGYVTSVSLLVVLSQYKSVLPIFRDTLRDYLEISVVQFGLLFSVGPLIGVASVLLGGVLVDRLGAVRMIRYCLQGTAVSFVIVAFAGQSYAAFMAAICVGALFAGPLYTAKQVYVSRLFPRDKRRVLSLSLAIVSGGGIVKPLLAEVLLSMGERVGTAAVLHGPFLVFAALLVCGSMLYRDAGPRRSASPAPRLAHRWTLSWGSFQISLPLLWLVLLGTCHGVADSTLHVWMPKFLASASFDEHPILPGVVLSGYGLAYLIARSLLALVPADFARRSLMILPGLIGGGLLIAGLISRSFWLTAGGYVAGAFIWSNGYPALLAAMSQQDRRRFGTAIAWKGVLTALLTAASIALVGALTERLGEERMWLVMILPASGFLIVGLDGLAWVIRAARHERMQRVMQTDDHVEIELQRTFTDDQT